MCVRISCERKQLQQAATWEEQCIRVSVQLGARGDVRAQSAPRCHSVVLLVARGSGWLAWCAALTGAQVTLDSALDLTRVAEPSHGFHPVATALQPRLQVNLAWAGLPSPSASLVASLGYRLCKKGIALLDIAMQRVVRA
jgi:hypothetical protein